MSGRFLVPAGLGRFGRRRWKLSGLVAREAGDLLRPDPQQIMVAAYRVEGDSFQRDRPRLWSNRRHLLRGARRSFDLHPDGIDSPWRWLPKSRVRRA